MQIALIINTIVCVLGVAGGLFLALASVISIANMTVPWTGALIVAAFLVPVTFLVSGVGSWIAHGRGADPLAMGLMAFPWVYGLLFVLAMWYSFDA
jgi:hypothetical protein